MKTTMKGSLLAGYHKPLAVKVKWHEGVDYDKNQMSIVDRSGKKYLCSLVRQPGYKTMMHLNLSGSGKTVVDGETTYDVDPLDASAEECTGGESYVVPATVLQNINRNVGAGTAEYRFDQTGALSVTMGGTRLWVSGEKLDYPLHLTYASDVKDADGADCPGCRIDADGLAFVLNAAIRMCRLNGKGAKLNLQAIHLVFDGDRLYAEGFSDTGSTDNYATIKPDDKFAESLPQGTHLAISLDAARVLYMVNDRSGSDILCSYQEKSHTITFSNNIYTHIIMTEDVMECEMPSIDELYTISINVSRTELMQAVSKAYVAGYKNVVVSTKGEGVLEVDSPDSRVKTTLKMNITNENCTAFEEFTLPVNSTIAALGNTEQANITVTFSMADMNRIMIEYVGGESYIDFL